MITIGEKLLTLEEVEKILYKNVKVVISDSVLQRADKNFYFLRDFMSDKVIYGINTGFGPMAQYRIPYTERLTLQYNLIRSHASGSGKPIAPLFVKAMILDRLVTLAWGKSGVHSDLLKLLAEMLNRNLTPVIYEHGGVGASGDLVQLAHMALAIVGEGEIWYNGNVMPAKKVLEVEKLTPFAIRLREGLALMNGTSCMTGIALVNLLQAKKLLHWSILFSAIINEIFEAFNDHLSLSLNAAKLHQGQRMVAELSLIHI